MRHVLRRSAIALALLAGVTAATSAQTGAATPTHVHRESSPPPRAQATDVTGRVKVHLQQMDAARAARLFAKGVPLTYSMNEKAMLPGHARLIAGLLDQYASEMSGRTADSEHRAIEQAVRDDLARLPELSASELGAFLPRHADRVRRLIRIHRASLAT